MMFIGLWWRLLQRWGIDHKGRQHLPCIINNIERLTEYTEDTSSSPADFNVEVSPLSLTPTLYLVGPFPKSTDENSSWGVEVECEVVDDELASAQRQWKQEHVMEVEFFLGPVQESDVYT